MNKKLIWITVLAFFLTLGQGAFASEKHSYCHCMKEHLIKNLDLTSEQKTKVEAIMDQTHTANTVQRKALQPIREQLHAIITSDTLDENKLDSLLNQSKDIIATMMKNKIVAKHEVYALLTPEQKEKFKALLKKWAEKKHHKTCDAKK